MRTPKQVQASRTNGARSKGPITPQGKLNSSCNSIRHGLLADTVVCQGEDTERFLELAAELVEEHQPNTRTEHLLVETIASATWRRDRIVGLQKVGFNYENLTGAENIESPATRVYLAMRSSGDCIRVTELLMRYETALDRQITRALRRLEQMREKKAERVSIPVKETKSPRAVFAAEPTLPEIFPAAARTQQTSESTGIPPAARPSNPIRIVTPKPPARETRPDGHTMQRQDSSPAELTGKLAKK